jgi:hypothetical protein|nr:DNA-binding protein [uncultured Pseudomonas sp.]
MELEELEPSKRIGPQQDVETVESRGDRNGLTYGTARAWAMKGVLPTVKVNSALLRTWLFELSARRLGIRSRSSA